jgi:hypothetical protein
MQEVNKILVLPEKNEKESCQVCAFANSSLGLQCILELSSV